MPLSRWSKRHEKTFGKKKEKWNGNFRLPPKPECYYTKVKGQCRWCGNMILNEDGSIFHIVSTEMSDYQFSVYEKIRKKEAENEKNKDWFDENEARYTTQKDRQLN